MNPPAISLIVLAAGKSARFGSNKLLFKLGDETLIRHVVKTGLESQADEVVVVIGYEADKITKELRGLNCRFVLNKSFLEGQCSSVITGIKFVKGRARATMILPGDMPLIRIEHINNVIEEYDSTGSALVIPSYQGRMGHPILFDAGLFDEILGIREETFGLKEIVKKHSAEIRLVEVESVGTLVDLDVSDDLKRIEEE